jgi:hypothetical protein
MWMGMVGRKMRATFLLLALLLWNGDEIFIGCQSKRNRVTGIGSGFDEMIPERAIGHLFPPDVAETISKF